MTVRTVSVTGLNCLSPPCSASDAQNRSCLTAAYDIIIAAKSSNPITRLTVPGTGTVVIFVTGSTILRTAAITVSGTAILLRRTRTAGLTPLSGTAAAVGGSPCVAVGSVGDGIRFTKIGFHKRAGAIGVPGYTLLFTRIFWLISTRTALASLSDRALGAPGQVAPVAPGTAVTCAGSASDSGSCGAAAAGVVTGLCLCCSRAGGGVVAAPSANTSAGRAVGTGYGR